MLRVITMNTNRLVIMSFVMLFYFSVCAAVADNGPCKVSFDDGFKTIKGQDPLIVQDVTRLPGKVGQGILLQGNAKLAYATSGYYDPNNGVVEMWVKREWNDDKVARNKIFLCFDNDPNMQNRAYVGFFDCNGTSNFYFSNDNGVDGIIAPMIWKKGEWHHLYICWDEALGCRGLYVDGQLKGAQSYKMAMPRRSVLYIGNTTDGGMVADSMIDEVVLYPNAQKKSDFIEEASRLKLYAQRRQQYLPVIDRLKAEYSLARVARDHIEVEWDDLLGMPTPLSQIVAVEERYHPEFVFVQPDMSVALSMSLGVGFAVGNPAKLPDYEKVTRNLLNGYLPIVQSQWTSGNISVNQTAFAYLPNDEVVVTGKETQYVAVRMTLTNQSDVNCQTNLIAMVCPKLDGTQTMGYSSYRAPATRWQQPPANIKFSNDALEMDGKALLVCRYDEMVKPSYYTSMPNTKNGELQPDKFTNSLKFDIDLGPRETRTIDFVMAGDADLYPSSEFDGMRKAKFENALAKVQSHWAKALEPATKIITPEKRLNDIYKQSILSNLQHMRKLSNRPGRLPGQTPTAGDMDWPWESAWMMIPMISIGYQKECEPSISYYTERQIYVGPYSENEAPQWNNLPARPDGDLKSVKGAYIGKNPHWMNETGSVLWIMSQYYRYSHDKGWLERNRPSILAAWDFIQNARSQTKILDDKGQKVRYYGLLPKGRVHDQDGWNYYFAWSDGYTWKGMSEMAKAFCLAGLPESKKMAEDVNEYQKCILDVVAREQFTDPNTNLVFIPNTVFYNEGAEYRSGLWQFEGHVLFQTGLLSVFDKRFDDMVSYLDQKYGTLMGLCGHWDPTSQFWYTSLNEISFYTAYLKRSEYEKALLTFYSNAVYSFSNDTYQGVERIDVGDSGYCPLQPNASGNGRYIDMLRRMVVDDQDADEGKLWLLRGCPRRWFAKDESVVVENAITIFGKFNIKTISDGNTIKVHIEGPKTKMPHELLVAVRHPQRKTVSKILVNGEVAVMKDEIVRIVSPKSKIEIICEY